MVFNKEHDPINHMKIHIHLFFMRFTFGLGHSVPQHNIRIK